MEERFMRVMVMFDIPTKIKEDRRAGTEFRKKLIKEGFFMMQLSVYVRVCKGIKSANACMDKLPSIIPKKGHIRALMITEKQFDRMRLLLGKPSPLEKARKPIQMTLF